MERDPNQDTLRVLVATDTHLGYMEKDELRGLDSFNAFDEVCSIAAEKEVDFLLLGGDLFHENKPSRTTLVRTIEILRRYCLSNRPVKFKIVGDQAVNFPSRFGHVNFEDPYFNVGLPVFTIHGNHDDPAGVDNLSAVDILSSCNLVNYFGKVVLGGQGVGQITLNPILIRKGSTNVALYGLGNIRDERLNRMFQTPHAVQWERPEAQEDCAVADWFNIFVIHQNRVKSNPKNAINEHFLARFLDFVVWGHEHECLVDPQEVPGMGFHVTQPGSSVATSLIEGEAAPKHVLLLEIKGNQYRPTKIPLHSVRPFLFKDISFKDEQDLDANDPNSVLEFLGQKVQDLISQVPKIPGRSPESQVPLVRLRVDYTGFTTINPQRFGQKFVGKVANPNDILLFTKASKTRRVKEEEGDEAEVLGPEELNQQNIEALVAESNLKMEILPVNDLGEALHEFVNKDDKQAFHLCVQHNLDLTRTKLAKEDAEQLTEEKYVIEKVTLHMQQREAEAVSKRGAGPSGTSSQLDQSNQGGRFKAKVEPKTSGLHDFSDDEDVIGITPARGKQPLRATGRGRASTKSAGEASGRGTAARGRGSRGGKLKQTTIADLMGGGASQVRSSARLGASLGSGSTVVQILESDEEGGGAAASDDEDDPDEVPDEEGSESDPAQTPARGRKRAASGTRGRGRGRGAKPQEPRAKRGRKSTQPANTTVNTSYIEDDLEDDDDDKPGPTARSGATTNRATRRSWGALRR